MPKFCNDDGPCSQPALQSVNANEAKPKPCLHSLHRSTSQVRCAPVCSPVHLDQGAISRQPGLRGSWGCARATIQCSALRVTGV